MTKIIKMVKTRFKGTKGDWEYCSNGTNPKKHNFAIIRDNRGRIIAYVYKAHGEEKTLYEANAKLMSAAPDLLEALLKMRILLNGYKLLEKDTIGYKSQERAFKAINKALL
jgi:hypothetical protein